YISAKSPRSRFRYHPDGHTTLGCSYPAPARFSQQLNPISTAIEQQVNRRHPRDEGLIDLYVLGERKLLKLHRDPGRFKFGQVHVGVPAVSGQVTISAE